MAKISCADKDQSVGTRVIHTVEMEWGGNDPMPPTTTCGLDTANMILLSFSSVPDPGDNLHLPCFN